MSEEKNNNTHIALEYLEPQEYLMVTTLVKLNETRRQNAMMKAQLEHILKMSEGAKARKKESKNESEATKLQENPQTRRVEYSEDIG